MSIKNEKNEELELKSKKFKKRRILAQVLASAGNSFQYFSLGAAINYGAVEVAGLSKRDDVIQTNENDLSWIGSICFIMQAIGNALGGTYIGLIGRKRAMLLGNLPYIAGWIFMWQSTNMGTLLFGNALLGLGTGLLCSPMASYTGEIVQPVLRGTLASISEVFAGLGACGVFIFGTMISWRITAAIYLGQALLSTAILTLLPESPIWLLSKGRNEDARRSLCWLRGWVKPEYIQKEFDELIVYNNHNAKCKRCLPKGIDSMENPESCPHRNDTIWQKLVRTLSEFKRREVRRPIILQCAFFMFSSMTGLTSIKPTIINILTSYNVTVDPRWAMAGIGILMTLGALLCMVLVKVTGKRPLVIGSMLGSCICTLLLGIYAQANIPHEASSYAETLLIAENPSVIPVILFILLVFCNMLGIVPISWMIISEIFPYTVRGLCIGCVGAICDVGFFIAAKTYLNVENAFHIYGALYFYSAFTFAGVIFLYLFLIETEGKSFAQIEASFADKKKLIHADDWLARKVLGVRQNKPKEVVEYLKDNHAADGQDETMIPLKNHKESLENGPNV